MVLSFSNFAAIDYKGHFREILTGFSSLAAFLETTSTFLKKKIAGLPDAEFNAEYIDTDLKSQ